MMGLGPPTPFRDTREQSSASMRNARTDFDPLGRSGDRLDDRGGTALFYSMSGMFFGLFVFALWYCPRHL